MIVKGQLIDGTTRRTYIRDGKTLILSFPDIVASYIEAIENYIATFPQ